jgi:hypothetical protein
MPWESTQQARWGHSPSGKKALGAAKVKEFDEATPKGSLKGTKGSKHGRSRTVKRGSVRVDTYES